MNSKKLCLVAIAVLVSPFAVADVIEVTFTGTVADGTYDPSNVFGFGLGADLSGKSATGVLTIDLVTAPPGKDCAMGGTTYIVEGFPCQWARPGFSWIESSLTIEGSAAPDRVAGTSNYENNDLAILAEGGSADGWRVDDWAISVWYPEPGKFYEFEDALSVSLYNADFLSGTGLDQEFTLTEGSGFAGVARYQYGCADNLVPTCNSYAIGFINILSATSRLSGTPPPTVPEPGTLALLGLGLAGLGLSRRRKA